MAVIVDRADKKTADPISNILTDCIVVSQLFFNAVLSFIKLIVSSTFLRILRYWIIVHIVTNPNRELFLGTRSRKFDQVTKGQFLDVSRTNDTFHNTATY